MLDVDPIQIQIIKLLTFNSCRNIAPKTLVSGNQSKGIMLRSLVLLLL